MEKQEIGVHESIYNSIMKCDESIRKELFNNIVLVGGSTKFPGFRERINRELLSLAPQEKIRIIVPPQPDEAVWLGGSLFSVHNTILQMWTSREFYEENGTIFSLSF